VGRLSVWCAADEPKPPPVNTDAAKVFLSPVTLKKFGDSVFNRVIVPNPGRIQGAEDLIQVFSFRSARPALSLSY
jgi:hypothetical protein